MKRTTLAVLLLTLAGCSKNIQTKEAVKEAVVAHLSAKQTQTGLDMNAMTVDVVSMSFQADTAHAKVAFNLKTGEGGMQMDYDLDRKGDKWVVRSGSPAGGVAPTLPPNHPPLEGGTPPAGSLPAGHPPTGTKK